MFANKLDLTGAQKEQAKQIMEASRAKVQLIMESLRENHQKLEDLSVNGDFNEVQVQNLATEQGNLTALLVIEKERLKAQMFQILTAEQRAQAEQLKAKMKEKFKNKFQPRQGAGENF
jgi:Spy/CpxP family protein refolding chaperone